jgi:hypothetical protein
MNNSQLRPTPEPLPTNMDEALAHRRVETRLTINDQVDQIYRQICFQKEYQRLIFGIYDEQATDGRLEWDDYKAAVFIKNYAKDNGMPEVANESLTVIDRAHQTVLRRWGQSRKMRRNRVGDTNVAEEQAEQQAAS